MMRQGVTLVAATLLALLVGVTISAADRQRDDCRASDPDRVIIGCTAVLTRGVREPADSQAEAYYKRALAFKTKGYQDAALADLDEAIRLRPTDDAHVERGDIHLKRGSLDRAAADYDAAIRLNPRNAGAYAGRAAVHKHKGNWDRAAADYSALLRLEPDNASGYLNRGNIYFNKGDWTRAVADYDEAIRLAPDNASAYNNRCAARARTRHWDAAVADCSAALRLDPKHVSALNNRGAALREKGDLDQALADLDEAIRLDPDRASAYYHRGLTHAANGDPGRALADFESALRLRPDDPEAAQGRNEMRIALASRAAARPAPAPRSQAAESGIPAGAGERRIALVIGNGSYRAAGTLSNPPRDAQAVANALRDVGFMTVKLETDLSRDRLVDNLRAFAAEAATADWAVVYYAGHGLEINGTNYLIPVDATLRTDRDVMFEAVPLDQVLAAVEGARKLRLVVLDACRDNPFLRQMSRTVASRSMGRGLARVEPEGGTLVAYAARHGQVALDGDGRNSPFVAALVKRLATPGIEIRKLFGLVRDDVLAATGRRQEPYVYGTLGGEDFFFRPVAMN